MVIAFTSALPCRLPKGEPSARVDRYRVRASGPRRASLRMGLFDSFKAAVSTQLRDLGVAAEDDAEPRVGGELARDALARLQARVVRINALEDEVEVLSDDELKRRAAELRERQASAEDLSDVDLAFALVREAAYRVLGLRHYDVQMLGGLALLEGRIAEMATGEGKTLVATLPVFFKALAGKGAHVVTVNDYLAERDARLMGQVHRFLGLSVGLVVSGMTTQDRRAAYSCDITYVTNSELGFDFLRDNLAMTQDDLVIPRPFHYCVVDEADSVLVDEARTPLIISASVEAPSIKYQNAAKIAAVLQPSVHYSVEEKEKNVSLLGEGYSATQSILKIKDLMNPSDPWAPYIANALKAKELFKKDVDYVVRKGEVLIVDEFTGRVMEGRRWSNGLHQSVEAKEGITVSSETQTNASISYQSFFRLFPTLSGMTGTAITEAKEFRDIYGLDVLKIPTALPVARKDYTDVIFKTQNGKYRAAMREIARVHPTGQPILIGTTSVQSSEALSKLLQEVDVPHEVLNAKPDSVRRESEIVAQAGRKYAITVATNMAGRGTDILLGGNAKYFAQKKVTMAIANQVGPNTASYEELSWPCEISDEADRLIESAIQEIRESSSTINAETIASMVSLASERQSDSNGNERVVELLREALEAVESDYEAVLSKEREEVQELGGLYVMGTCRHESRRIDNQLRGRSGRQGDPGASRFFLALDDDLFRVFGGDKMTKVLTAFRVDEDTPIENAMVTNTLNNAQKEVEEYYAEIRKRLFEFDEVMTSQREVLYSQRRAVLSASKDDLEAKMQEYCIETLTEIVPGYVKRRELEDAKGLLTKLQQFFNGIALPSSANLKKAFADNKSDELLERLVSDALSDKWCSLEERRAGLAYETARFLLLTQIDNMWRSHMRNMEFVKEASALRTYENVQPLDAYREEGQELFTNMLEDIRRNTVYSFFMYEVSQTK